MPTETLYWRRSPRSVQVPAAVRPKAPEASEASEAPKAPEAQEALKAPEAPKTPEAPKAPEAPKTPDAQKAQEAPKAPDAPKAAKTLKAQKTPEAQKPPEAPNAPKASKAPKAPKASKTPKEPEAPITSKAPEASKPAKTPEASNSVSSVPPPNTSNFYPQNPLELYESLIARLQDAKVRPILTTKNSGYVEDTSFAEYRGIVDRSIVFMIERGDPHHLNIEKNATVSLFFVFNKVQNEKGGFNSWQVRINEAKAVELNQKQISKLCTEDMELVAPDGLQMESTKPAMVAKNAAYKVVPTKWDFYKVDDVKILDRVHYRILQYKKCTLWKKSNTLT